MTVDDLAEALDVSHGTAHKITRLPRLPDASKFKTPSGYVRKVAKIALRNGFTAGRIPELGGNRRTTDARPSAPAAAPAREDSELVAAAHNELQSFGESLGSLRSTVTTLGATIASRRQLDAPDLQIIDRYQKLQAELRQSEKQWLDLQEKYALVFRRDDVYETTSALWVSFRASLDALISLLTEGTNLPTWLDELGGGIGDVDQRTFAAIIRDRAYKLLTPRVNEMSDALRDSASPGVSEGLTDDCRQRLAEELRRVAAQLDK